MLDSINTNNYIYGGHIFMKKLLISILSILTIFALSTAVVFAARHHQPNANAPTVTIAQIQQNGYDDQRVLVEGKFTDHKYKDVYVFTDTEGNTILAEVDDDIWYQLSMDTPVRIYAEVDKDWHGVELDVKNIEKLK